MTLGIFSVINIAGNFSSVLGHSISIGEEYSPPAVDVFNVPSLKLAKLLWMSALKGKCRNLLLSSKFLIYLNYF